MVLMGFFFLMDDYLIYTISYGQIGSTLMIEIYHGDIKSPLGNCRWLYMPLPNCYRDII